MQDKEGFLQYVVGKLKGIEAYASELGGEILQKEEEIERLKKSEARALQERDQALERERMLKEQRDIAVEIMNGMKEASARKERKLPSPPPVIRGRGKMRSRGRAGRRRGLRQTLTEN